MTAAKRPPGDYAAYLFDLDGTLYRGDRPLPGAAEVVRWLRARGKKLLFLSNNPLRSRGAVAEKLTRLGLPAAPEEVLTTSHTTVAYLTEHHREARLYVIGDRLLQEEIRQAGLRTTAVGKGAEVLVVSWDRGFTYAKLNHALQALRGGALCVLTNPDPTCPMPEGEVPDAGSLMAAIRAASGRSPDVIIGKPSPILAEIALRQLGVPAQECLLTGDRLATDIAFGRAAGMATALVLTGVTRPAEAAATEVRPDYVWASLWELIPGREGEL